MTSPLLTYIVPLYNTEAYVQRCLQSIVDQGLEEDQYEVLVVDDGSTDGSKTVVEAFIGEHPQVRLLTQAAVLSTGDSLSRPTGSSATWSGP